MLLVILYGITQKMNANAPNVKLSKTHWITNVSCCRKSVYNVSKTIKLV